MTAEEKAEDNASNLCRLCFEKMQKGAKVCPHCQRPQSAWLDRLQHLSTITAASTAIVMVFLALGQYLEAKKERIEAETVLLKAQNVMDKTDENSRRIISKADAVLDNAKSASKEAVSASSKALTSAKHSTEYARRTAGEVKSRMEEALHYVKTNVSASDKKVKDLEKTSTDRIQTVSSNINGMRNEFASELSVLKERNRLIQLGDRGIGQGDRKALEELQHLVKQNPKDQTVILSEILRIKGHYVSGSSISYNPKFEDGVKIEKITTEVLLKELSSNPNWRTRGVAARLLGKRKEKAVPDALIRAMEHEQRLDVLVVCMQSFEALTGYDNTDVFNYEPLKEWWQKNKAAKVKDFK